MSLSSRPEPLPLQPPGVRPLRGLVTTPTLLSPLRCGVLQGRLCWEVASEGTASMAARAGSGDWTVPPGKLEHDFPSSRSVELASASRLAASRRHHKGLRHRDRCAPPCMAGAARVGAAGVASEVSELVGCRSSRLEGSKGVPPPGSVVCHRPDGATFGDRTQFSAKTLLRDMPWRTTGAGQGHHNSRTDTTASISCLPRVSARMPRFGTLADPRAAPPLSEHPPGASRPQAR